MFSTVTIWKRKERVNWLVVLREALWAYIEYKRIPPNPRLGAMTIIPLTPSTLIVPVHHLLAVA